MSPEEVPSAYELSLVWHPSQPSVCGGDSAQTELLDPTQNCKVSSCRDDKDQRLDRAGTRAAHLQFRWVTLPAGSTNPTSPTGMRLVLVLLTSQGKPEI